MTGKLAHPPLEVDAVSDVAALLQQAEAGFSAGDRAVARVLLRAVVDEPRATAKQRAHALSDLGVIAFLEGERGEAEARLLAALSLDATCVGGLENLSALCECSGDLVQATHWARRAAEADPTAAPRWHRLAHLLLARRRFGEAEPALAQAAKLGADVADELSTVARHRCAASPDGVGHAARAITRVLVIVDYFHPSLGGSERLAEAAGVALGSQGMAVDVATRSLPERSATHHRGMPIHEIGDDPVAELSELVGRHRYDALLIFSAPFSWPLSSALALPHPRPRILAVPCINAENSAMLRRDPATLQDYADRLGTAEIVGFSSRSGPDVRLCEDLGLDGVYLPNATELVAPAPESPTAGLAAEGPLLLMVANMWPEKNHVGLLRALRHHPGEWRLAIIGSPSPEVPHIADEVVRLAAEDPRVALLGGAHPTEVAAAMTEARLLLLPSLAEATPLVLLEAMSRRLPWIATPTCGAAHDHAGGLILPLAQFGEGIEHLLADADAARTLGDAGRAHWESCYTWAVMGPRYAGLLRGEPVGELTAPEPAIAATESVRAGFYDRRAQGATAVV